MADPTTPAVTQAEWDAVAAETATSATPTEQVAVVAEAVAAAVAPEPVVEVAADPYEGLSPDVKAKLERFDALSETTQQTLVALKETQGRVSYLQSEFAKSRQASPAAEAPSQKQLTQAAKDPEKWAALKKDFPEWGEGIEALFDARLADLPAGMTAEQIQKQIADGVASGTGKLSEQFERELIATKYPDWDAQVKTPAFAEWFPKQTPEVRALADSTKGRDALRMLDLFHEAVKTTPAVRTARAKTLAAAVTAKPGPAVTNTKTFDDLNPKEQWEYLAAERARKAAAEA